MEFTEKPNFQMGVVQIKTVYRGIAKKVGLGQFEDLSGALASYGFSLVVLAGFGWSWQVPCFITNAHNILKYTESGNLKH